MNIELFSKNKVLMLLVLLGVILTSCTPSTQTEPEPAETSDKPNIVFILVDDMGFADVGYNGSEIATPNLDMMAQSGVVLDRNYVYPICSPTRAALLTGRSPLEFGIDGPLGDGSSLPLDVKIMPEYFKDLGYQTAMVGKWHLGISEKRFFPQNRGFDYFYGFLGGWIDFYTHTYEEGLDWQRMGTSLREEGHATQLMTDDAKQVIKSRNTDKPLFLYLSFNAPHSPLQTLPEDTGLNSNVEAGDRYVYAEMMTDMDAGVGEIINTLKSEGIFENTILIFSSDNGGLQTLGASNVPLRGGKGMALEGGMRVPGLIWWPGEVKGGRTLEQMVVVHDWLPTLMDAIGGNPQDVENAYGQTMWSAIRQNEIVDRAPTIIGVHKNTAVFDWPWKLTNYSERGPNGKTYVGLYNIETDPGETTDLKMAKPEIFDRLTRIKNSRPRAESLRTRGPKPERLFLNEDGSWNYEVRIGETREPWAEAAND